MLIFEYRFGQLDYMFTDRDTKDVERMCSHLDNPTLYDSWDYYLENGDQIQFWRKDGIIHGNIFGHDEKDIPESSIANGNHKAK